VRGSPDWTRTSNPSINSRMLCQLSYGGPLSALQKATRPRRGLSHRSSAVRYRRVVPVPEFIIELRRSVGHDPLWLMASSGVVVREMDSVGHVLLVRRSDNGQWTVTAGVVEPGEDPTLAAEREVLEEAGVVCRAERLAWVYVEPPTVHANGDAAQYVELVYSCRWLHGEPTPADSESTEALWCRVDELPPMHPYQRARIAAAMAKGPTWLGHDDGMRKAGEL
jgi:8-oxo-dGTP pyrophosphatase MutT (NUDIX family)